MNTKALIDYFLLISPSSEVNQKVYFFKQWIREILGHSYESEFSKAHITLKQYYDLRNDAILYDISDNILPRFKPFEVFTDGFGIFEHGQNRTLFLNIVLKNTLGELIKEFSGREGTPHITVARNMPKRDFDKIWSILKKEEYKSSFKCNSITVLRGDNGIWKHYTELPLA